MRIETYLPIAFKYLNYLVVLMWRMGLGKLINIWPSVFGRIMVIKNYGRSSGSANLTPVNYFETNDEIYCISGFGSQSDWYLNIMSNPQVEIWLPDGWFIAKAEDIDQAQDRLSLVREVLKASGFAAPIFGINPRTMNNFELESVVEHYRLLKITRQAARTGSDGPGGLAWLWPFVIFFLLLRNKRQKR